MVIGPEPFLFMSADPIFNFQVHAVTCAEVTIA